jgi:hypothetical protein
MRELLAEKERRDPTQSDPRESDLQNLAESVASLASAVEAMNRR